MVGKSGKHLGTSKNKSESVSGIVVKPGSLGAG